jgi:UDP-glucose:(heptosyl)LPS alpha-1,3-glucosyltransferase
MKIAILRRAFDAMGGAELYLQRLTRALAKGGHEVHLFAERWDEVPGEVRLRRVPRSRNREDRVRGYDERVRTALGGEEFDCVFSLERTRAQDVFRVGDGVHRAWLEQKRRHAAWWRRPFTGHSAFHRAMVELEAQALDPGHTGCVVVNSEMVKNEILRHYNFPEKRMHLIRNGVELERWRGGNRTRARARLGVNAETPVVLFAGSSWTRKGLPFLIEAMRQLPRARLVVAGRGRRPWGVPDNVDFIGPVPDLENVMAAADVFALPAIYEPSANVCFEALAAGVPVVTSVFNGAAEVVEPSVNGTVLEDPADAAALVAALEFWLEQKTDRPVPVRADLSLERNVRETLAVIGQAAEARS